MRPRLTQDSLAACLIITFVLSIAGCSKSSTPPATDTPLNLPAGGTAVTTSANQFAINIFQQVLQTEQPTGNVFLSPLSIYLALDMTYNGAAGTTADSMATTLRLSDISTGELNSVCNALLQQLPKEDSRVQLSLANSIWYNQIAPQPSPAFLDSVSTNYQGTIQALDFNNQASINTINSWVAKNTANKITTIIDQLNSADVMVLINAIYFNGAWTNAFKTSDTKTGPFYLPNGTTVSVPFMNQTMTIRTASTPAFTLAELPYGTAKGFDMYIALPTDQTKPINEFAATLNATALSTAVSGFDSTTVQVILPKWEYYYTMLNMQPELSQLGMGIAFSTAADFSKMYPTTSVAISKVIHKAYIKVSEEGTEAAAVTAVKMTETAVQLPPAIRADHPFVYFIMEKQTGLILFMGIVNDPSKN